MRVNLGPIKRASKRLPSSPLLILLLLTTPILWGAQTSLCSQQPPPGQQQEAPSEAHLGSIFEHQRALADECRQLAAQKARQVSQVLKFGRQNEQQLHLPDRLTIKLPAVCLLLAASDFATTNRLDQANWIYRPGDELLGQLEQPAGRHLIRRRQAGPEEEPTKGNEIPDSLGEFLLDGGKSLWANNKTSFGGKQINRQLEEFHRQTDSLLSNNNFKQALEYARSERLYHLSPVVLVPGLLGSRLQARVEKASRVNIFCSKSSNWTDMWLSLRLFLPFAVDCWLDNVRLEFDPATGFARPPVGVKARVPDFGSVESVRHLDPRSPDITGYFNALIDKYQQLGYTADQNLFAAPYDFRLAPQQLESSYFVQLRNLIERAQAAASNQKATLVCHSMGCTHLLIFLRQQAASWRQHHVRKVIALSSPWAGTVKALKALVVGDGLDLPLVGELKMRQLARTFPSISYLLPQAEVFRQPDEYRATFGGPNLVETPERDYKVADLSDLLRRLNLTTQLAWFEQTSLLIRPLEPLPDVQFDCIHSTNIPTPETIHFRNMSDFPDGNYELIEGDGDGTVNRHSLEVCAEWASRWPDRIRSKVIRNTNHLGVISHPETLAHIADDILVDSNAAPA